ncbi:unnamed protein product [Brassica napus]|uniref:(rape) hypothetical protein n=1 Tax=Brassica napus TaxID=3708 RepID=A0A816XT19_BRANA|nr:unnamed protein product [Brassica napus]
MISIVIMAELLVEYTTALAKLTVGILPRRQGDGNFIRIGNFSLYSFSKKKKLLLVLSS